MTLQPDDTFGLDRLRMELIIDEGRRLMPYLDTTNNITIGIGRNLSSKGISSAECEFLWRTDVQTCVAALDQFTPWWRSKPANVQRFMLNLAFNMGWGGLSQFRQMLAYLERDELQGAAQELQDSRWWGQVHSRGPRMVGRLLGDQSPLGSSPDAVA